MFGKRVVFQCKLCHIAVKCTFWGVVLRIIWARASIDVPCILLAPVVKMAIILPTGQWYAPSAVINYAWYCVVKHGIALYCMVLHGIAWYCMVLQGIALHCMVLHDIA